MRQGDAGITPDRKSTRLNSSHVRISYAVFCLKKKITFLCGAFGILMLLFEEVSKTERVQFRYYAMVVGLISGGLP